jgi:hypothetical protein
MAAMRRRRAAGTRFLLAAASVLLPFSVLGQTRLNFVSCPIVRDTSTVPCWLTRHDGELYYMGIQTDVSADFHPPYLGHQVLVEATVAADQPRICGGIVLEPIRISVMPELDGSCNTILPAEARYRIDFNPRPPGPSAGRLAFAAAPGAPAEVPPPPSGPKTFYLYFDVDQGIAFRHPRALLSIRDYAQAIAARSVTVRASRGSTLLTDGGRVTESEGVAERRGRQVVELLTGVGVQADIRMAFSSTPEPADGIDDWMSRRVEIRVEP